MTLRTRIALLVAGAVVVTVTVVSGAAYASAVREVKEEADAFLDRRAVLVEGARDFPRRGGSIDPRLLSREAPTQVVTPDGEPFAIFGIDSPLPVGDADVGAIRSGTRSDPHTVYLDGRAYRVVTVPLADGWGLTLARDLSEQEAVLDGLARRFSLIGLAGALVAGAFGWFAVNRTMASVDSLAAAAEHVAHTQDLAATIEVERDDEVGRLARSFNTMLEALARSRSQQQRLINDASHELRTPLTSLRTNIEFLAKAGDLPEAERKGLLDDVRFELEELSTLVSELVELATDTATAEEPLRELPLDDLVARVVDRSRRRSDRDIRVVLEPTTVEGRPALLERAVANLLDNAVKWSPPSEVIEVTVAKGQVAVRDGGPGIGKEDKDRVFDRFYRSEDARSMPGSGLGLSIVKEIVTAHGGSTFVEDAAGGGAVVGFYIPEQPERPE